MYRILSLDGGGIRGLFTLMVLKRIEQERPGTLNKADLVAGTSVGGIIALGIAAGADLESLIRLFSDHGFSVFPSQKFAGKLKRSALSQPKYPNDGLANALRQSFGDTKLGQLARGVMVSSFALDNKAAGGRVRSWGPKFFHNLDAATGDLDLPCWKAGLYTSAAPTYFPSVDGYIDGGVAANNPAVCALSLAKNHLSSLGIDDGICMMSIGTGKNSRYIEKDTADWGIVEWSPYILPLLMDAPSGIAEYQCKALMGDDCLRIDTLINRDDPIGLDELKGVPCLIEAAESLDLEEAKDWLDRKWV